MVPETLAPPAEPPKFAVGGSILSAVEPGRSSPQVGLPDTTLGAGGGCNAPAGAVVAPPPATASRNTARTSETAT
jgi:hypothetical protein